ncbi:MAG: glycosyltransferase [Patescibacteria group bacterium]
MLFAETGVNDILRVPVASQNKDFVEDRVSKLHVPWLSVRKKQDIPPLSESDILAIDKMENQGLLEDIKSLRDGLPQGKKILFISGDMGSIEGSRGDVVRMMAGCGVKLDWVFLEKSQDFKKAKLEKGLNKDFTGIEDKNATILNSAGKRTDFDAAMHDAVKSLVSMVTLSDYACVFLDDLFPLAMIPLIREKNPDIKIVWVCRRDISRATDRAVAFLNEQLQGADSATFWHPSLAPKGINAETIWLRHGINPLSLKNKKISRKNFKEKVLARYDINPKMPYILHLGRFGVNKNHFLSLVCFKWMIDDLKDKGVQTLPQLVLAGEEPKPGEQKDSFDRLNEFCEYLKLKDHVKILALKFEGNERNNALEVNALQSGAIFGVHPPHSEALSLVVLEDGLKGTPVVATKRGGLGFQISREEYLVDLPDDESNKIRSLYWELFIGKPDFKALTRELEALKMPKILTQKMLDLYNMHIGAGPMYSTLRKENKGFIQDKFLVSQEVFESLLLVTRLMGIKSEISEVNSNRIDKMVLRLKSPQYSL